MSESDEELLEKAETIARALIRHIESQEKPWFAGHNPDWQLAQQFINKLAKR